MDAGAPLLDEQFSGAGHQEHQIASELTLLSGGQNNCQGV